MSTTYAPENLYRRISSLQGTVAHTQRIKSLCRMTLLENRMLEKNNRIRYAKFLTRYFPDKCRDHTRSHVWKKQTPGELCITK